MTEDRLDFHNPKLKPCLYIPEIWGSPFDISVNRKDTPPTLCRRILLLSPHHFEKKRKWVPVTASSGRFRAQYLLLMLMPEISLHLSKPLDCSGSPWIFTRNLTSASPSNRNGFGGCRIGSSVCYRCWIDPFLQLPHHLLCPFPTR